MIINNRLFCRVVLSLFLIANAAMLTGCAQLAEKFIRKPKEEAKNKRYYVVKEYDVHPSIELYTKRYIFWKTWHKELLDALPKGNRKKIVVAVEQEVSNLMDMRNMLVEEKALLLQEDVEQLTKIEMTIKKEGITRGNEVRIRRKLKMLGKKIKRDFSYKKMKGCIRDDFKGE